MFDSRKLKVFGAALALTIVGAQANAQPAGNIAGLTPSVAAAAGLGLIAAGFIVSDALDDDDDGPLPGDGGDDGGDTPSTSTTSTASTTSTTATTATTSTTGT